MQLLLEANVKEKLLIRRSWWLDTSAQHFRFRGKDRRDETTSSSHPPFYLLVLSTLLFSVPDFYPHGEQSDAEAQD